jgi:hypothetical protein
MFGQPCRLREFQRQLKLIRHPDDREAAARLLQHGRRRRDLVLAFPDHQISRFHAFLRVSVVNSWSRLVRSQRCRAMTALPAFPSLCHLERSRSPRQEVSKRARAVHARRARCNKRLRVATTIDILQRFGAKRQGQRRSALARLRNKCRVRQKTINSTRHRPARSASGAPCKKRGVPYFGGRWPLCFHLGKRSATHYLLPRPRESQHSS